MSTPGWQMILALDSERRLIEGAFEELRRAIAAGADLRIYSEFYHDEHIDTGSRQHELVQESMDMRATYLLDGRWAAGVLTLRQPVELPDRFGPRPSLSLFLYNEDGSQAIARPFLDGPPTDGPRGPSPPADHSQMPKYRELDRWDDGTNAPSSNFIYAFETLRYFVRDDWREVLRHDADGNVLSGSVRALAEQFRAGAEFKVGISDVCRDLAPATPADQGPDGPLAHEVFIQLGSCYFYTEAGLFVGGTHPLPRVGPAIPLRYASCNWDYAWLIVRTDGQTAILHYDPYTLSPRRASGRFALRWFCR